MTNSISIIVPFYKGNEYITNLINSVIKVKKIENINITDIIIVNDSPWIEVMYPSCSEVNITVIKNKKNMGIHASRVVGVQECVTDFLIFLDQDDELMPDGFKEQFKLIKKADVVIGNGFYQYGDIYKSIFKNMRVMKYLIRKENFLKIRNLIPSPGSCLLRKHSIPKLWLNTCMEQNGADDWYLWLLMFAENKKFEINSENVYKHNSTSAGNLSADLKKMYQSCMEMCSILKDNEKLSDKEIKSLESAINFKYLQDTQQLRIADLFKYFIVILNNIKYKLNIMIK